MLNVKWLNIYQLRSRLADFRYLHPFQRYLLSKSEVVRKHLRYCMFFAWTFLVERAEKFWDLAYKAELTSDDVAKFHSDRPRELGELALIKKEIK